MKEAMAKNVPRSSSQVALIELVFESKQKRASDRGNIPANIRMRFREHFKLTRDDDPYVGWSRNLKYGPIPEGARATVEILTEGVIQEILAKRS